MSSHLVLLHGLGRTAPSMVPLAREGRRRGYLVLNLGYPSRTRGVAELTKHVAPVIQQFAPDVPALDFVTHSLGGILIRAAVRAGLLPLERIGRVVMLAPPNRGSEAADFMRRVPVPRHVPGPALADLGIDPGALVARLGPMPFECGVIAGSRSVNPILSYVISGRDDGKVAIARATVHGVRDFIVVPHSHPFIMRAPTVHRQAFHFLEHGRFARSGAVDGFDSAGHRNR